MADISFVTSNSSGVSVQESLKTQAIDTNVAALQGEVIWIDSGTIQNGEKVWLDPNGVHAVWLSLTHGKVITTIADVGNEGVVDYFMLQEYPDAFTASGSGTPEVNSEYPYHLVLASGSVMWANVPIDLGDLENGMYVIGQTEVSTGLESWAIQEFTGATFVVKYYTQKVLELPVAPPKDPAEWLTTLGTTRPPAALEYTIPPNQYVGRGAWSGAITIQAASKTVSNEGKFADIKIANGDFVLGDDLETAVGLSLMTDRRATTAEIAEFQSGITDRQSRRGYWANTFRTVPQGSGLWLLSRSKHAELTRSRAEAFALESLQWLKDDNIAQEISVVATLKGKSGLDLTVRVLKPSGEDLNYAYQFVWE